ncbi:MAG: transketolase C-terminal domain-containing protein [Candidatus Micrarchaeaceae archaeon]
MITKVLTGSGSVANAIKLAFPDIIAAYPITPQTEIVEDIATMIKNKELFSRFIKVDSEHSAMSACIGASAAGARVFTATSSHGLMYMAEVVYWAAHSRLPIVMAVATRSLAAPWSILNEHTDYMIQHSSGWIQAMVENGQEAFDTTLMAFKIAEDARVSLPFMVGLDGFILTHTSMPVSMPSKEEIQEFIGKRIPVFEIDINNPLTFGNVIDQNYFMEMRYKMYLAMQESKQVINAVSKAYATITGREYGLIDCYNCDDADHIVVTMGASSGDAKVASNLLRKEGIKAGVLRVRVMRPFPGPEIVAALSKASYISIVERAFSPGIGNILAHEIKSVLYDSGRHPIVRSYIAGLGGRDITPNDYIKVVKSTIKNKGDAWVNLVM